MDHLAAEKGITVSQADGQAALSSLNAVAQQDGAPNATVLLVANGVPPQLFPEFGRWYAQDMAYSKKVNGGTAATTQAEQDKINKAQCTAAEPLNIQVSPQFGRIDYASASFARFRSGLHGLLARPSEARIHVVAETRRPLPSGPMDPRDAD